MTDADFSALYLDYFRLWTDDVLCNFLSLRQKPTNGSSEELVARAFICWKKNNPVNGDAEYRALANLEDYKRKLIIGTSVIPDPFGLQDGWIEESSSMTAWPLVFFCDIAEF